MKIIAAPDSFKGSLSASEAAEAIRAGVLQAVPEAEVIKLPLADGGEGTVQALVDATSGRLVTAPVVGPLGENVDAVYGFLGDGETAVIEMAAAAGLGLVPPERRNPELTTTYGVGQLIHNAVQRGAIRIIVGVGGSATNDGGAGALQALGIRFFAKDKQPLPYGGAALRNLAQIDVSGLKFPLGEVEVVVACDVDNPLIGPNGASAVYGPQKGADSEQVKLLDEALRTYAQVIHKDLDKDIAELAGAGAAGGLAGGLAAFLGAELRPGVEIVLDAVRFDEQVSGADLVITGEGRIDGQTLHGKTISGVLRRRHHLGIPVVALAGCIGPEAEDFYKAGLTAMFSIVDRPMTEAEAFANVRELLRRSAQNVVRLRGQAK